MDEENKSLKESLTQAQDAFNLSNQKVISNHK